jgi:hypothetical protein
MSDNHALGLFRTDFCANNKKSVATNHSRRDFLSAIGAFGIVAAFSGSPWFEAFSGIDHKHPTESARKFRVWVFSDAHVGRDEKYGNGRKSLADALQQSESQSGFDWNIALDLGDMSGDVGLPKDPEGAEIVRQFGTLKNHRREQIYDLSGNHDRSGLDEPQAWWWRKWLDPTGGVGIQDLIASSSYQNRSQFPCNYRSRVPRADEWGKG